MSDETTNRPQASSTRPASRSNRTGILLAGAAAVALLLGGGYYAFKNASPSQTASSQVAPVADNSATLAAP